MPPRQPTCSVFHHDGHLTYESHKMEVLKYTVYLGLSNISSNTFLSHILHTELSGIMSQVRYGTYSDRKLSQWQTVQALGQGSSHNSQL